MDGLVVQEHSILLAVENKECVNCFGSAGGKEAEGMWTVVYIAPNRATAESLKKVLSGEGLLVMLRPAGSPQVGDMGAVEILVPESEAEEAHEILTGALSG